MMINVIFIITDVQQVMYRIMGAAGSLQSLLQTLQNQRQ